MSFSLSRFVDIKLSETGNVITDSMNSTNPTRVLNNVVGRRVGNFALGGSMLVTRTIDTVVGVVLGVPAIFSNRIAENHLNFVCSSVYILSDPFKCFVKTINPNADFNGSNKKVRYFEFTNDSCREIARVARDSDTMIIKHVVSRLVYVLSPIAATISRLFQGVIGLGAALISIGTLGIFPKVNIVASQGLQFTKLFKDLSYFAIKIINPWAGMDFLRNEPGGLTHGEAMRMMYPSFFN